MKADQTEGKQQPNIHGAEQREDVELARQTGPDTRQVKQISASSLCDMEKTVDLGSGCKVNLYSIQNATITGERTPLVFTSAGGVLAVVEESHVIAPMISWDLGENIKSEAWDNSRSGPPLKDPVLFLAGPASENYFHWMHDCLPRLLAAEHAGLETSIMVPPASEKNKFILESLEMLGISPERILEFSGGNIKASEVWLLDDLFPNEQAHQILLNEVRDRLLVAADYDSATTPKDTHIFLAREGAETTRALENHAEVEALLGESGYTKVRMEELSLRDQILTMASATEVVAQHGAGMFNTLFMEGGRVIELFPTRPDDPTRKLVEPCWFRILAAHESHGRTVQLKQLDCQVRMLSNEDLSQYNIIADLDRLRTCLRGDAQAQPDSYQRIPL